MVAIGGWTGSQYFSANVNSDNRAAFVKAVVDFATQYNVDGIDFDWEYPGTQGIGCNEVSNDDTTNFLAFLQALRQDPVGKELILTVDTPLQIWNGESGAVMTDVSGFASALDWMFLMNYEVWGSWYVTCAIYVFNSA